MLKIRLSRVGRKHVAKYRVVLTDHRQSAKHGFIKVLGSYDPHTKILIIDQTEADKYIATGAQYSDTLAKIVARTKQFSTLSPLFFMTAKEFLHFMISSLVEKSDAIEIEEKTDDLGLLLSLKVDASDI